MNYAVAMTAVECKDVHIEFIGTLVMGNDHIIKFEDLMDEMNRIDVLIKEYEKINENCAMDYGFDANLIRGQDLGALSRIFLLFCVFY